MTILELYFYANIYLLFLGMFYKIFFQKHMSFKISRLYINSSMIISLLIPLLQNYISLKWNVAEYSENLISLNINFLYNENPIVGTQAKYSINYSDLAKYLIFSGSILTFIWLTFILVC